VGSGRVSFTLEVKDRFLGHSKTSHRRTAINVRANKHESNCRLWGNDRMSELKIRTTKFQFIHTIKRKKLKIATCYPQMWLTWNKDNLSRERLAGFVRSKKWALNKVKHRLRCKYNIYLLPSYAGLLYNNSTNLRAFYVLWTIAITALKPVPEFIASFFLALPIPKLQEGAVFCYEVFSMGALAIDADPLNVTGSCRYVVLRCAYLSPALSCMWSEAVNVSFW